MGRIYTGRFDPFAITTAVDLFEILAAADIPVMVHGWHLQQSSDLKDVEEEVLLLETKQGVGATGGSGGQAAAEYARDVNDAAASCAIECRNTTIAVAGGGSLTTLEEFGWNLRLPWDYFYPPELRPRVDPGELWVLTLTDAPADSVDIGGTIWVEEI